MPFAALSVDLVWLLWHCCILLLCAPHGKVCLQGWLALLSFCRVSSRALIPDRLSDENETFLENTDCERAENPFVQDHGSRVKPDS
jgi:hypothetical protein